ncbi:MAG: hypothetical protein ACREQL_09135 [Candidatus Binatia bacterium]
MRSPLAKAIAALAAVFERLEVRWYLFGAQAALLYGAARLTADIDVTVDLGGRGTSLLVRSLAGARGPLLQATAAPDRRRRAGPRREPRGHHRDEVLAGRGKDEDDAVAILAARRTLKVDLVRATLAMLERALDQTDLGPRFEDLLVRARRRPSRG